MVEARTSIQPDDEFVLAARVHPKRCKNFQRQPLNYAIILELRREWNLLFIEWKRTSGEMILKYEARLIFLNLSREYKNSNNQTWQKTNKMENYDCLMNSKFSPTLDGTTSSNSMIIRIMENCWRKQSKVIRTEIRKQSGKLFEIRVNDENYCCLGLTDIVRLYTKKGKKEDT